MAIADLSKEASATTDERHEVVLALRQSALSQWDALWRHVEHGWLNIDNNAAERALKRVAIGRKNCQFLGCGRDRRTDTQGSPGLR